MSSTARSSGRHDGATGPAGTTGVVAVTSTRAGSSPPGGSAARASTALRTAREERASLLLSVASGMLDLKDAIEMAATDPKPYLRKVRLRQLLLAQEGWGAERAERAIYRIAEIVGEAMPDRRTMLNLRLSWLLDSRTGGSRFAAFHEAVLPERERQSPPWPGYPFAPRPQGPTFAATGKGAP